ncbi:hypothetical protein Peur_031608 [Populus x canadensis]
MTVLHSEKKLLDKSIAGSCGGLICIKLLCYKDLEYVRAVESCYQTDQANQIAPINRRVRILSEGFGCSGEINDYKMVRIGLFYRFPSSDSDDDSGDRRERRRLDPVI